MPFCFFSIGGQTFTANATEHKIFVAEDVGSAFHEEG